MHRVVAPQAMRLGEITGAASERVVDVDEIEFLVPGIELSHSNPELTGRDPSETVRLGKRSAALGVDKSDAHDAVRSVPQQRGTGGAGLGNE